MSFQVEIIPCDEYGDEYAEADNVFADNPEDLVDKNLSFIVKINNCKKLPEGYTVSNDISEVVRGHFRGHVRGHVRGHER